jgi:tetratricopeptide repeat protein
VAQPRERHGPRGIGRAARGVGPLSPAEIEAALREAAAHFAANRLDEAERIANALVQTQPRSFHVRHLLAALAARRGRWEECIAASTAALSLQPGHPEALSNRGAALRMLGRIEAALADYDQALRGAPNAAELHNNRGVALAALNRHAEAIAAYTRALELKPAYERARFNRAMSRLVTGDFEAGWRDHESRWSGSEMHQGPRVLPGRAWDGREDVRGRTLLLYAEQGLGDAIQFARYATLAHERGARVLLEVHPPLAALLAGVEGVDQVVALGQPLPPFDLHCALMSLPLAFGTRLESIPARIPYIAAPPMHAARWRERLGAKDRPRVGLAWSGSRTLRNDANRSIALARLAPLARSGVALVAVQKDIREADRDALRELGIASFADELHDFRDTAALVEALDLVVSVDTSAAHLAGAMGKPLWVLLPFSPDWRWLLDRDASPWYPTARLFRQPRIGDWDAVIERVAEALRRL